MNRKVYVPDGSRAAIAVAFQCACRSRDADRYSLQAVTEVAVSSSQYDVVPQMIIRLQSVMQKDFCNSSSSESWEP
jgi:hypothetical protein